MISAKRLKSLSSLIMSFCVTIAVFQSFLKKLKFQHNLDIMDFYIMQYSFFICWSFRRGTPSRHEGRGPRGRDSFPGPDDFVPEENFDSSEENARGRDHSSRGRGRGTPRGIVHVQLKITYNMVHIILKPFLYFVISRICFLF